MSLKHWPRAAALVAAVVMALGLAGCGSGGDTAASSPPASPAISTTASASAEPGYDPAKPFTVTTDRDTAKVGLATGNVLFDMTPKAVDSYFAAMAKDTGVRLVRTDLPWSGVQKTRGGDYDWSQTNVIVAAMAKHGFWGIGIHDSVPAWATDGSCGDEYWLCPPSEAFIGDYLKYVAASSARYCGALKFTENLNEPNSMKWYQGKASVYALMHVRYVATVKAACPTAIAIPGGTSANENDTGARYRPNTWYSLLCQVPAYHAVALFGNVHPYPKPARVANSDPESQWYELAKVRRVLQDECGVTQPHMLITEIGWPTGGGEGPATDEADPKFKGDQPVTNYRQAYFLGQLFAVAKGLRSEGTIIDAITVYSYRDTNTGGESIEENHGLVNSDGLPKAMPPVDADHPEQPTAVEVIRQAAAA